MHNRLTVCFLLLALVSIAPGLQAAEAPAQLPEAALAAAPQASLDAGQPASDCSGATGASALPMFAGFDAELKSSEAPNGAVCDYQQRTSYVCNCNLAGGTRYRKVVEDRCCYPWGCTGWSVVSSSCTNYPC